MTLLLTPEGKTFSFYIEALAYDYQKAYGGIILTPVQVVEEQSTLSPAHV